MEVSRAAYNLIENVQKVSNLNPLPMTEFKNIQEATVGMMLYLNIRVNKFNTIYTCKLEKKMSML